MRQLTRNVGWRAPTQLVAVGVTAAAAAAAAAASMALYRNHPTRSRRANATS